ncbi:hypothetical protein D3C84_1086700 [compost metagenome]
MGEGEVRSAGLWIAGRVVVNQHGCRGVVLQGSLDDFSWIDAGTVQGAPEQFLKGDHPVTAVEQEQGEYLMLVVGQQRLQVAEHFLR